MNQAGARILCISSIDWDFVWQAHQEIMSRLAAAGNQVVFLENTGGVRSIRASDAARIARRLLRASSQLARGERRPAPNLTVMAPVLLPFPRSRLATWINDHVLLPALATKIRRVLGTDPVIYSYLPTTNTLRLIDLVAGSRSVVVYHCLADYAAVSDDPDKARETEHKLVERSDIVFAQNSELARRLAPGRVGVELFGFGVDLALFDPTGKQEIPDEVRHLPRPIMGYIGALHRHVDMDLVRHLARSFPTGSVVLVGPVLADTSALKDEPNIHLLGPRAHAELPAFVAGFDVGLIPYKRSRYTETVNPAKLFEYLAMGIPVVSSDLPEVVALQLPASALRTASDRDAFASAVRDALDDSAGDRAARRELARKHDWAVIAPRIAGLISQRRQDVPQ